MWAPITSVVGVSNVKTKREVICELVSNLQGFNTFMQRSVKAKHVSISVEDNGDPGVLVKVVWENGKTFEKYFDFDACTEGSASPYYAVNRRTCEFAKEVVRDILSLKGVTNNG